MISDIFDKIYSINPLLLSLIHAQVLLTEAKVLLIDAQVLLTEAQVLLIEAHTTQYHK